MNVLHCIEKIIDPSCGNVNSCRESEIKTGRFALQQCVTSVPIIRSISANIKEGNSICRHGRPPFRVVFNHS